jgi:hypothetical protein
MQGFSAFAVAKRFSLSSSTILTIQVDGFHWMHSRLHIEKRKGCTDQQLSPFVYNGSYTFHQDRGFEGRGANEYPNHISLGQSIYPLREFSVIPLGWHFYRA